MKRALLSLSLVGLISACGQNATNPNFTSGSFQTGNPNCFAGSFNYPACLTNQGFNNTCSSFNSTPINNEQGQQIGYRSRQTLISSQITQQTAQSQVVITSTQVNEGERLFVNFTGAIVQRPHVTCILGGFANWIGPVMSVPVPASEITVVTPDGSQLLSEIPVGQGIVMEHPGTVSVRINVGAECVPVQTTVQLQSGNGGAVEVERCCTNSGAVGMCP
jgi:hypothetical protein